MAQTDRAYRRAEDKLFGREYTRKGSTNRTKALLSQDDIDFLNDPRNVDFRQQAIQDYAKGTRRRGKSFGNSKKALSDLTSSIASQRGVLLGQDFFSQRPTYTSQDIENMIAQQKGATLQGVPTVSGFGQGVLPMLQGGFQAPMSPPVFGQGGGLFAGGSQPSQGVLGNLATQGMGQMGAGQTMNPTIFRGKV